MPFPRFHIYSPAFNQRKFQSRPVAFDIALLKENRPTIGVFNLTKPWAFPTLAHRQCCLSYFKKPARAGLSADGKHRHGRVTPENAR